MANGDAGDIYYRGESGRRNNRLSFLRAIQSPLFDENNCYFSQEGGAFVLFMKGHIYHPEEVVVAKVFANHGYNVLMTPEDRRNGGIWVSNTKKGRDKFVEGRINGRKYEQSTINANATNISGAFNKALDHAVEKGARIAVSYDKHGKSHLSDVQNGIARFKSFPRNSGKVDTLFVVTHNGKLYKHKI